jgi:hypothetical protein
MGLVNAIHEFHRIFPPTALQPAAQTTPEQAPNNAATLRATSPNVMATRLFEAHERTRHR